MGQIIWSLILLQVNQIFHYVAWWTLQSDIFILKHQSEVYGFDTFFLFLGFEKAFDSIKTEEIILKALFIYFSLVAEW